MATTTWRSRLAEVQPLRGLESLPPFVFQFVLRNLGAFTAPMWLIAAASAAASILGFLKVVLLGTIITELAELEVKEIISTFVPLWLAIAFLGELLGYFLRRYGETVPTMYTDHLRLRLYRTFLQLPFGPLLNFSKERLAALVGRFLANVLAFLEDLIWGTSAKITRFILIMGVLFYQSIYVGLLNLAYMAIFLSVAFYISARFSEYARQYAKANVNAGATFGHFTLHLSALKRLRAEGLFLTTMREVLGISWDRFNELKKFHAARWFLQLNLFNLMYIGTLAYGIYQVKLEALPLGFLVLIKWSFDELWHILVYAIEYYVSLLQQREDSRLLRQELAQFLQGAPQDLAPVPFRSFESELVSVTFSGKSDSQAPYCLRIPHFSIRQQEKIGIIGPSGAGKSTLLNLLLNIIPYEGAVRVNGELRSSTTAPLALSYISSLDPLFQLSLLENITLGRPYDERRLELLLEGLHIKDFAADLSMRLGHSNAHLSAGQESRIKLARGLLCDEQLYLMDEPFVGIDAPTRAAIISFLKAFLAPAALLLVTHDPDDLELVTHVYRIEGGELLPAHKSDLPG